MQETYLVWDRIFTKLVFTLRTNVQNLQCCMPAHGEIRKHLFTGRVVKALKGSGGVTAPESVQKMSRCGAW